MAPPSGLKGSKRGQERAQWDGRARSRPPAEPMAAARRLRGSPTSGGRRGRSTGLGRGSAAEGKMAAALVLAAGLRVARRAVVVAGPRGAQVRSGRGHTEGSRGLCRPTGPGVGVPPPGARGPAASRGRSPKAGQGMPPLPRCKLRGCAVRAGWWAPRSRQGQCIGCCLLSLPEAQLTERLLRAASSAPPAGSEVCLLGDSQLPLSGTWPSEHVLTAHLPHLPEGSGSSQLFLPQCDSTDFSEPLGKWGFPTHNPLGLGS